MADAVSRLIGEAESLVELLTRAAADPGGRRELLRALGWELDALAGFPVEEFVQKAGSIGDAASDLAQLAAMPPDDFAAVTELITASVELLRSIQGIQQLGNAQSVSLPDDVKSELVAIGPLLAEFLIAEYLNRYHPVVHDLARVLTLLAASADHGATLMPQLGGADGGPVYRRPAAPPRFRLRRLIDLITDPVATLRADYLGPDGLKTIKGARYMASRLFDRSAPLLVALGAQVADGSGRPDADHHDSSRTLEVRFPLGEGDDAGLGALLEIRSDEEGGARLEVTPAGWATLRWQGRSWTARLDVTGEAPGFAVTRTGVTLPAAMAAFGVRAVVERMPSVSGEPTAIGPAAGTRLDVGPLHCTVALDLATDRRDLCLELAAPGSALLVCGGDGDSFLSRVMPADGLRVGFDPGLGWSNTAGLVIMGGASLAATLPVKLALGPIELQSVYLALDCDGQARTLSITVAPTVKLEIGPLKASVDQIGLTADLSFPDDDNSASFALALRFKQPSGIGVSVKTTAVTGGGYLFIDERKGQYAGALELAFEAFSLNAIGLLNTKLPDGSPIKDSSGEDGWSLLVVAAAKWNPVHIAYGIHIGGAGIVVGLHRTTDLPALREGVRTNALDAVLFPNDPVANAPHLVTTLGALFPVAPDRYVFGLMGRFTWGAQAWLSLELALLLEIPSPLRLIVLGRVMLSLPEQREPDQEPAVLLRLDSVGILDLDRKEFTLDATFVDSKIAGMPLSGDMAVRASWGRRTGFALSAGGFHPGYAPPPGFPALQPITLKVTEGDNPKVVLTSYLAITSNSVQFGARLDLAATAMGFTVAGNLAFDALIRWSPFGLDVAFGASVSLSRGGRTLACVVLDLRLVAEPWVLRGTASFSLWFLSGEVPIHASFGPPAVERTSAAPIDPGGRLVAALRDPGSWATRPPDGHAVVTLRGADSEDGPNGLLVHPLAEVGVHQAVLPLGIAIQRLGGATLDRPRRYTIEGATFGASSTVIRGVPRKAAFAPGEFFDLTDDQRLSRPDFEMLEAGTWFEAPGDTVSVDESLSAWADLSYEPSILDAPPDGPRSQPEESLTGDVLTRLTATGPVAVAPVRRSGAWRFGLGTNVARLTTWGSIEVGVGGGFIGRRRGHWPGQQPRGWSRVGRRGGR